MKKIIGIITGLIFSVSSIAQEQIDFRVKIPDSWRLASYSEAERLWVYESKDGNHQLTVSILYYSKAPTHSQQKEYLSDFLKTRQEQSSKIKKTIQYSSIEITEYNSAWIARFNERTPDGRLASTKAISSKVGIANFYFESFSSKENHEEVSNPILKTTGFSS